MDIDRLDSVKTAVDEDSKYIIDIAEKTVLAYTKDLDRIMLGVKANIINVDNPPINVVEKYFLELSNSIYFIAEKTESIGIFDGISKVKALETYNNFYMESQSGGVLDKGKKPTIAESTAYAQSNSMYDNMINEMYSRAYKMIKAKLDAAQTMVSTLSKVLSKRMTENQFSIMDNSTRKILNEDGYEQSSYATSSQKDQYNFPF